MLKKLKPVSLILVVGAMALPISAYPTDLTFLKISDRRLLDRPPFRRA